MKNIQQTISVLFCTLALLWSCNEDEDLVMLNDNLTTTVTAAQTAPIVLDKENEEAVALELQWEEPNYGFDVAAEYIVQFDIVDGTFDETPAFGVGNALKKSFNTKELNDVARALGIAPDTPTDIAVRVQGKIGKKVVVTTPNTTINVTAYSSTLNLGTTWGVVGGATANGWDGPDQPFYKTNQEDVLVAYVTLTDGEIKFRENNDWTNNYGDTGADGTLEAGGDNIAVTAGTYKILFNITALTYSIEAYTWGLVGSATANGWDGPDMKLEYDPTSDQWRSLVVLADGEIKFRKNNDWGVNFGDTGADGTLEAGGDNIAVAAGRYLVTLNLNQNTYTIESTEFWGLVGSATPNGWDGPDLPMQPDYANPGQWIVTATLVDGEMKFRANNDWGINFGDDGADGTLESGGANIVITAGTYDIVLDVSKKNEEKYTIKAKK
ncbi:MAG: SusF/SusE family outer membrane protein [Flavobacteriaceae bacterium]|nr:SusF/SusE family outer membrane protein [Flavobacteriaceae bacterium]